MDGWMDGMDGWMDGWNGWMDGWTDEWLDKMEGFNWVKG
jgi:hypothetical protein